MVFVLLKQTGAATETDATAGFGLFSDAISSALVGWSARPKWTMKACQTVRLHKSAGRRPTEDVSSHRPSQKERDAQRAALFCFHSCAAVIKDVCSSFPGHERPEGTISHQTEFLFVCLTRRVFIFLSFNFVDSGKRC